MIERDEAERAADVYGVAAGGAAETPNELKGAFALAWFVQLARYVQDLTFSDGAVTGLGAET